MTSQEKLELNNFFEIQKKMWLNAGFHNELKLLDGLFYYSHIQALRSAFDTAVASGRVLPLGNPDVIPFLIVMSPVKISIARQFQLFGFKNKFCYIDLKKVIELDNANHARNYILYNIDRGRSIKCQNKNPLQIHKFLKDSTRHPLNMLEAISIMRIIEDNRKLFPWLNEVMILGARYTGNTIPCVNFGDSVGPTINTIDCQSVSSSYRSPVFYTAATFPAS